VQLTLACVVVPPVALQAFPLSVLGIILRGVCLMRPQEIHWMFGGGAGAHMLAETVSCSTEGLFGCMVSTSRLLVQTVLQATQ
jgi:hypothetical protein